MRTFVFYPDWLDCINRFTDDNDKNELRKIIIDYGVTGEYQTESNMIKALFESLIKPKIDMAQQNYQESVEYGKTHGRRKKVDDEAVRALALEGYSAQGIAQKLGISTTAVYHSDGWKYRKM